MVAKLILITLKSSIRPNLAKIHMVAKRISNDAGFACCPNLAKIHMVAKPQTDFIT